MQIAYIISNMKQLTQNIGGKIMEKKDIKKGMTVVYSGRNAEVSKIQGSRAKVCPFGESSRWVKIADLKKIMIS